MFSTRARKGPSEGPLTRALTGTSLIYHKVDRLEEDTHFPRLAGAHQDAHTQTTPVASIPAR